mmetsp:Transcript_11619/g.21727  ORF Transcript_11619/g.21727 Transcript_11619/m.21727 type:complete len:189 (+) Transcript_11619:94-660(+)
MSSFFSKIGKIITPSSSTPSSSVASSVKNVIYNKNKGTPAVAPTTAGTKSSSASKAKERLSLILASQRNSTLLQGVDMQALQQDVLQVLKKYIYIVDTTTPSSTGDGAGDGATAGSSYQNADGGGHGNPSILHCDVKNIPNDKRGGEQMTLLEMTVEIDPQQTISLHRGGGGIEDRGRGGGSAAMASR